MKSEPKISSYVRQSVFTTLKEFCIFSITHEEDYMEVTEWKNGEGFDVEVNGRDSESFKLTFGQFKALKKLVKKLENEGSM